MLADLGAATDAPRRSTSLRHAPIDAFTRVSWILAAPRRLYHRQQQIKLVYNSAPPSRVFIAGRLLVAICYLGQVPTEDYLHAGPCGTARARGRPEVTEGEEVLYVTSVTPCPCSPRCSPISLPSSSKLHRNTLCPGQTPPGGPRPLRRPWATRLGG